MSRKHVFFVNAAYCYAIFRPLQDEIRRRGGEAAWFFSREVSASLLPGELHLRDEEAVKDFAPDVMYAAGDWLPYYLPGLKVMLFHGIAKNKRGSKNEKESEHYTIRGWYDLYCTHAEKDTARFQELAAEHQNFRVKKTGWPKLDPLFKSREAYRKGADSSAFTLFFASTFSPSITAAPAMADVLEQLSQSGRCKVLATLHPLMDEKIVQRYQSMQSGNFVYLPAESDLYAAMAESDVMLCDTSSIMYEYMFLNRPVVTFRTKNPGPFLLDVQEADDVVPALERVLQDAAGQLQAARNECLELHEFEDGKSSARVLDAVEETLAAGFDGLKKKPLNLLRKFKLRKRLGYWGR